MVSACAVHFDDLEISIQKASVPDEFVYLFQESERQYVAAEGGEDDFEDIRYVTSRSVVLARLDLAGCTAERAEQAFYEWLDEQRESHEDYGEWAADLLEIFKTLTYEDWKARAKIVLETRYDFSRRLDEYTDELDRVMRASDDEGLFFSSDYLLSLRGLLEAMPHVKEVSLSIGPLIHGGWLEEDEAICLTRREPSAFPRSVLEPAVIITEGSTDVLIMRRSLDRLYPHLKDYIVFFDYDGSNSDAGASWVVKFLKAFMAARINTLIVAVFDNDAAGNEALNTAEGLKLPDNIKLMRLPDIELGRTYPTIGPQGTHAVDINGAAVGIELFAGRHNLLGSDGQLTPVVWSNYVRSVSRYQGALLDKSGPLARFLKDTEHHDDLIEYHSVYPELRTLWESVFRTIQAARVQN